jgi:hypothetical protein
MRWRFADAYGLGRPEGDASRVYVVPAVGLGYSTSVIGELLGLRSVEALRPVESVGSAERVEPVGTV